MTGEPQILAWQQAYEPRTPWRASWAIMATMIIYGTGVLALSGILSVDRIFRGLGRVHGLWREDMGTLITVAVYQIATIVLTIAASALFKGKISDVLALRAPVGGIRMYCVAAALTVVTQVVIWLAGPWLMPAPAQNQAASATLFGEQWQLALLVIGIGAPLSEELLFRGFLLSAMASTRLGFWPAAIFATIWWTFLHAGYSVLGFISVFVMGLLYSWQLWWSGSLRVPLVCHVLYNIIVVFWHLKIGYHS